MSYISDILTSFIRRLVPDQRGNVAIIFALCLPVLVGGLGLGVETSYWYYRDLKLQAAADAAAYAGALEKNLGSTNSTITDAATVSAVSNSFDAAKGTIVVNTPPKSGPNTTKVAVEVILNQPLDRFFTSVFGQTPVLARARAVALITQSAKACILALSRTDSKAALFSGSADVKLTGCVVMSNSNASDAVQMQGSTKLTVDCLVSVGGINLGSTQSLKASCGSLIKDALPASDPYANLPVPTRSTPCQNTKLTTLQPGTYCNGLSLSGTVTLAPGVYVIEVGDFRVNANALVTGDGVTIYLSGGTRVSINGNATVKLSAPKSGIYSGVLFFGDRANTGGSNTFNGTADSLLTGAIYFASQQVKYLGNFAGIGGCTQVVASTVEWSGNAGVSQDCTALGMKDIPATQSIQLVE